MEEREKGKEKGGCGWRKVIIVNNDHVYLHVHSIVYVLNQDC